MNATENVRNARVTQYEKNRFDKQWYKNMLDYLDYRTPFNSSGDNLGYGYDFKDDERIRNDKINYNLYNGIIDKKDFEYVYQPLGQDVGELPADFTNKDIISGKIKVLLGMELERTLGWQINAINPEATTRKEKAKFEKIQQYVVQQIMQPIQQQIETKYAAQMEGRELLPEEQQQIEQTIAEEMKAMTPEEVNHYMKRKHQDPAEIMMNQVFRYVIKEQDTKTKFNQGWKHANISAKEIYWMGIINGKPIIKSINPLHFAYDKESDEQFFENGEWAGVELWLTPSQVIEYFGTELTNEQIDDIYLGYNTSAADLDFNFSSDSNGYSKIRVLHRTWKALRKVGFVAYIDPNTGGLEERLEFDEAYQLNPEMGDVNIEWEWIPEVYEGYKINKDIYVRLGPIAAQPKDLDNIYDVKLPYYGGIYDNVNSQPTSLIDRMKPYQYYYNIIMYRTEMLMASDKGKLLLLNMNMIPASMNIDMKQWLYYAEALNIGWMNPNEEGNQGIDVTNAAKEIDMSLVSDIQKYIQLAEFIEMRCGSTIGVTKEMEGRIGQYQAVKTTEAAITQGNYIIEPYFDFHNIIKTNALTGLLELSALAYATNDAIVLDYILDDYSRELIRLDKDILSLSRFGLFVGNSMDTIKVKEAINNLGMTAMQNQTIDMSDVIKVLKTETTTEAEEVLAVAEEKKRNQNDAMQKQQMEHEKQMLAEANAMREKEWEHEEKMIIVKERERRETEIQKQTILALGFAEDKDVNDNNVPDVLEVAKAGVDANIKMRKQDLDENKFEHQKGVDKKKLEIEDKKASQKPQAKKA